MPFILSIGNIRSIMGTTDSNNAERQQRSIDNIAQHPQYRKAILRIGESNIYHVHYLNHLHNYSFLVSYPIISLVIYFFTVTLDLNSTIQDINTETVTYVYCISNSFAQLILSSSHRSSVYSSSASDLLC